MLIYFTSLGQAADKLTDFEAATAATLVSFGAAIHLLSVSLDPATHTFALAAGSIIAIIASVTHVAQAKRSDEKVSLFNKVRNIPDSK